MATRVERPSGRVATTVVGAPKADAHQQAFVLLREVTTPHWLARSLRVAVALGVADLLGDSPRTADELAADTGADGRSLGRILRLLAAHGIFEEDGVRFAHTPASRLLRQDQPHSVAPFRSVTAMPQASIVEGTAV